MPGSTDPPDSEGDDVSAVALADSVGQASDPSAAFQSLASMTIVFTLVLLGDLLPALLGLYGILATQLFVILVPTLVYSMATERLPMRALGLARPPVLGLAAAVATAGGMCLVATAILGWQIQLMPISVAERDAFEALQSGARSNPLVALMALVLAPAVAEEALFRGLLLTRLRRRLPDGMAIAVSALLFGLFHRSAHRFIAQTVLGFLAGSLVVRGGSLWLGVAMHGAYNLGILMLGAPLAEDGRWGLLAACGIVIVAFGLWLLRQAAHDR